MKMKLNQSGRKLWPLLIALGVCLSSISNAEIFRRRGGGFRSNTTHIHVGRGQSVTAGNITVTVGGGGSVSASRSNNSNYNSRSRSPQNNYTPPETGYYRSDYSYRGGEHHVTADGTRIWRKRIDESHEQWVTDVPQYRTVDQIQYQQRSGYAVGSNGLLYLVTQQVPVKVGTKKVLTGYKRVVYYDVRKDSRDDSWVCDKDGCYHRWEERNGRIYKLPSGSGSQYRRAGGHSYEKS